MKRKITWSSGCYDEIELVYEKAKENEMVATILFELEEMALKEAEENCTMLKMGNIPIAREIYHAMSDIGKERVMECLAGVGLQEFFPSMTEGKVTVTFTPDIQKVLGCTMFSVLNCLEKLDGAMNLIYPNVILELRVPIGAKKGMVRCEILIMQLYPWLSIKETSTDFISSTLNVQSQVQTTSPPKEKKSFINKLFGKK